MIVRIIIGLVLIAFFALGGAVLLYGAALHFKFTDASDPFVSIVGRWLWLAYLVMLELIWGTSAAAILWPGQRNTQLRRVLGYGAIAVITSAAVLMVAAYIQGHGRFYTELAGLVLASGFVVGIGQMWSHRQTRA